MQNKETNFKVKNNGVVPKPPKYFTDFANKMLDFVKKQEQFNQFVIEQFKKQEQFNAKQEQFNQFVIEQFKAHRWIK